MLNALVCLVCREVPAEDGPCRSPDLVAILNLHVASQEDVVGGDRLFVDQDCCAGVAAEVLVLEPGFRGGDAEPLAVPVEPVRRDLRVAA